jgi:antirestriction protein ArdC
VIDKYTAKNQISLKDNSIDCTIEEFIANTKADIRHGDETRAFYTVNFDFINMPKIGQFNNSESYYNTLLHELTHWTGHKSRCDRELKGSFGSESYGKEELVAEIGSAIMSHEFKLSGIEQSASYCENWLKAIHENNNIIFSASTKADEAVSYLKKLVI